MQERAAHEKNCRRKYTGTAKAWIKNGVASRKEINTPV